MPSLYVNLPRGLGTNSTGLLIVAPHQVDHQQGQPTMFHHEVSGLFYESNNSFKGGWITSWAYVLKAKVKNNNLKIFEKRGSPWFPGWGRGGGRVLFLLLLTKLFFRICSLLNISAQLFPRSLKMAPLFPAMFFLCSLVPENHYLRKIFCCRKMEFPCLSYVATRDKCFIS